LILVKVLLWGWLDVAAATPGAAAAAEEEEEEDVEGIC
jgi:hypothetical protein